MEWLVSFRRAGSIRSDLFLACLLILSGTGAEWRLWRWRTFSARWRPNFMNACILSGA